MKTLRPPAFIFVAAFLLNFAWEYAHSVLYLSYRGGEITSLILFRAALFDAAVITLFAAPFFLQKQHCEKRWLFVVALSVFAVLLERWALGSSRWVYADAMPIIPVLNVGLTPAIQLGLLGYISQKISEHFESKLP
ncbi:MAG: hypothetical protein A2W52_04415 [Candidatus Taylorbacteria bacterium RIFCSPHIGHO2_02_49_25]|uniref:Uncharacterized protein n=1 Tax=Candidatus Taylorbacteria bacterium RIFCSPHIGHO2_02_49_25 TaxID=1802305 RepID=A0A1G2MHL6_9BACT|nr:MAG: hypothetical protein UY62_C0027G0006 [Parcubacteria group bacterium GW2011_GWF2_50_9]OHA19611.1 MAG: hypothetical protein A2759_02915 [Candidatus Taylorbacteria bacterium RIFCSPHIGHO2_01_FULL_49_60]OHA23396.1 MAG: hypothetical protein A2W52_04415 [Candidatus Taylorbacteria bacterium RIFCSPHIGHO2_02_49_25]OHA36227.1 MAG: hypothetical protein A2W65_01660 [Candidatus Taylorbacteria bacterium RIFCSPLOWO2_02_50_13]OHA36473.1 MAG: hypothetical protein A3B27_00465 [Candidatus Taylorbacteria ba